jgi:hypothetical protein
MIFKIVLHAGVETCSEFLHENHVMLTVQLILRLEPKEIQS